MAIWADNYASQTLRENNTAELHGGGLGGHVTLAGIRRSRWLKRSLSGLCSEEMLEGMCPDAWYANGQTQNTGLYTPLPVPVAPCD